VISERLISRLVLAHSVVAFTGAGISAESGVPTFRGADGLWQRMRPEELASMEGFLKNPSLVWEWYAHRRRIIQDVRPNPGHQALVEFEKMFPVFAVITQNIDNLHRRAGSRTVYELHGNIERNYCLACGSPCRNTEVVLADGRPSCVRCGGLIRPDVVWFGEVLPEDEWDGSVRVARSAEVFLSVGTSAVVYPAASLPMIAKHQGAFLVEVNPEPTALTDSADEFLRGPAGVILPELLDLVRRARAVVPA
jgi:NAD-dependent protein deacetylase/lipoamidase